MFTIYFYFIDIFILCVYSHLISGENEVFFDLLRRPIFAWPALA